ncbi:MAG: V-type ATP synthase subunit F [Firmicutes bacterium]|jgi:V/A-type H+-transporting ATPase subunit F|nr:V-type ATP synthase subunit F [Bacillota bacterium]
MYNIAVIGDLDSVYGFASLGLDVFPTAVQDAPQLLRDLAESGYGVIYITEELAAFIRSDIERYAQQRVPAIIQIPGIKGNTGAGIEGVKKTVEQAVGSDILFGTEPAGEGEPR